MGIDPESRLAVILRSSGSIAEGEAPELTVNSSHHQSVSMLGDGLRLAAWSTTDDVKEAVEGTADDHFVLCVQWHPERTFEIDPASRAMFQAFIKAAAEWHKKLAVKQKDFESVPGKP